MTIPEKDDRYPPGLEWLAGPEAFAFALAAAVSPSLQSEMELEIAGMPASRYIPSSRWRFTQ